jgi:hypothetical protein
MPTKNSQIISAVYSEIPFSRLFENLGLEIQAELFNFSL